MNPRMHSGSRHLLEAALHGFVGQQQHGAHQVPHQDEVPFSLQIQGHDVIIVIALGPQLLLCRPLVQTHLSRHRRQRRTGSPLH